MITWGASVRQSVRGKTRRGKWDSTSRGKRARLRIPMAPNADAPLDLLWKEYSAVFRGLDDLSLARWLAQTLGQLEGKAWRLSHPLLGAYRLAAQLGQDKHIWFKRLANPPA